MDLREYSYVNANMLWKFLMDMACYELNQLIFPIEESHKLASASRRLLNDATKYCRLVGRIIYLTITRPELAYELHILS